MYILKTSSLTREEWFTPESYSLNLTERDSTATITLGPEDPDIAIGAWIEDPENASGPIVWRARTVETDAAGKTRTITLEHIIRTLNDLIMFGEVSTADLGGGDAKKAAQYILSKQSDWALDAFGYSESAPFEFDGDSLMEALETVTSILDGAMWVYDMSVYPFKISIVNPANYFSGFGELRAGRNMATMRRSIDRSRMYTRFYPIGENDLHISGDYVSRNEDIYGIISKVETDQSKTSESMLRMWANERLRKHCEPIVTITVSGLELSRETGEDLDRMILGRECRIPLPEYGTTIQERITKIQWRDRIKEPENITVTLANNPEDIASIVKNEQAAAGKSGRGAAKKAGEDHAWFVDTDDHVAMVAEAIVGDDGTGKPNWSRVSEVIVDGGGIHQRVTRAEGDIVTNTAAIEVTENAIRQEVTDRTNADLTLSGRISVEAGKISQIVSAVGADGEVTAASIVLAINDKLESSIKLDADVVYAGRGAETIADLELPDWMDTTSGLVASKASIVDLNAVKARVSTIEADYLKAEDITATRINSAFSGTSTFSANYGFIRNLECTQFTQGDYTMDLSDAISAIAIDQSGNNYTLKIKHFYSTDWQNVKTFSRATTLLGRWSGGTYTVTASPQGSTESTTLIGLSGTGDVSRSGKVVTQKMNVQYVGSSENPLNTGAQFNASINASSVYDAGWAAAYGKFSSKISAATDNNLWVKYPPSTVDGDALQRNYYVTADSDYAYIRINSTSGTVVARCDAAAPTVDSWSRTNFSSDTTKRNSKTLSIPVSVKVNGTTYSHTFTTGSMSLERYDSNYVNVQVGSTIIARLYLYDD